MTASSLGGLGAAGKPVVDDGGRFARVEVKIGETALRHSGTEEFQVAWPCNMDVWSNFWSFIYIEK